MPELPEVETVRTMLDALIVDQIITGIWRDPDHPGAFVGPDGIDIEDVVRGRGITCIDRRGKYLIISLGDPWSVIAHLRMTGRLLVLPRSAAPVRFEHARIELANGNSVRYGDQRKFGGLRLATPEDVDALDERLGIEPLSSQFRAGNLMPLLARRPGPIKNALLDQGMIAGLGNIYADEALFRARIHPRQAARSLDESSVNRLIRTIRSVLRGAIRNRGTTFSSFENPYGESGANSRNLRVYGRKGEACLRCGQTLEGFRVAGRGTTWCPVCQPLVLNPEKVVD